MQENLPPLPGEQSADRSRPSLTAYVLRGRQWIEIGTATPHRDGKGHQLRLDIAPEDGDIIELRARDIEHYPARQATRSRKAYPAKYAPRNSQVYQSAAMATAANDQIIAEMLGQTAHKP